MEGDHALAGRPLPPDTVGLLEGLTSTRAIRRYTDDPVPSESLRAMLFAATRAPSGSNRQPFRFLVLTDGPRAAAVKRLLGEQARAAWSDMRSRHGYDRATRADAASPKARLGATMQEYAEAFERVPALILPCIVSAQAPIPLEGASVYPACQNLLLAARALGYGGVLTGLHRLVDAELRTLLDLPDTAHVVGAITIGRPRGKHGPVRRRPMSELVFGDGWERPLPWAVDPPGTEHTKAGPAR